MPTLLVVDDSVTVQRVIALTFAEHDVQVVSVSDPHQAMEQMTAQKPDIVLAASVLTQISGYDLARWMRNTPELHAVPVLLLVGAFEAVDEAKLAGSGASGTIDKPIEPTTVINRVKELLGLKAETKPAPTGRLITSMQGPRDKKPLPAPDNTPAFPVTDKPSVPAAAETRFPDAVPPRVVTSTIGATGHLGTLDAAFDDLDQQLSGPAPATTNPRNPVFEVDGEWFTEGDQAHPTKAPEQQQPAAEKRIYEGELPEPMPGLESAAPSDAPDAIEVEDVPAVEVAAMPAASATPTPENEQPASVMATSDFDELDALLGPATAPYTPPSVPPAPEAPEAPQAPRAPSSFAELLAYEQGERPAPRVSEPAVVVAPPVVATMTEEMLDQIAARVAERLSASVFGDQLRDAMTAAVRDTVHSVVADTSERIVRDEIDRIRSNRQAD
jgi:CheY-like chemotaxis protein